MVEYIREQLSEEELLCQLAEEATELAQAALKLRRAYDGSNPTPVTGEKAFTNLQEEIADVKLLLKVLGMDGPNDRAKHSHIMQVKTARWARRLEALKRGKENDGKE